MRVNDFKAIRDQFEKADIQQKIELYVNSDDLSQEQYRELLKMFPIEELSRLEYALNERQAVM